MCILIGLVIAGIMFLLMLSSLFAGAIGPAIAWFVLMFVVLWIFEMLSSIFDNH